MSNSRNPELGAKFQEQVKKWFEKNYNLEFKSEVKIPIGKPPKEHKFDIANLDKKIVVECKRYTWTETGNVPSAKMGFVNEAAFYLSLLPKDYKKYIVMLKDFHSKRKETLASYYCRTYNHLLGDIIVAEYDAKTNELETINTKMCP